MEVESFDSLPNGALLRHTKSSEYFFAVSGYYNSNSTLQVVRLSGESVIPTGKLREAVEIVGRRIPILQVCTARRGLTIWLKKMEEFRVDFEEVQEREDVAYHKALNQPYNMEVGPLWRVKLVRLSPREVIFMLGVQHAITDSFTNHILCKAIVNALNDLLVERSPSLPVYKFPNASSSITNSSLPLKFLIVSLADKVYNTVIKDYTRVSSIKGLLPIPKSRPLRTDSLTTSFARDTTSKIREKCREQGVKMHAFVTIFFALAMYRVALKKDRNLGRVPMNTSNPVDLRRYYPKNSQEIPGCHVAVVEQDLKVSADDLKDVWPLVRRFHNDFHDKIDSDLPLSVDRLAKSFALWLPVGSFLLRRGYKTPTYCNFGSSNMREVDGLLDTQGEVKITDSRRSVTLKLINVPCAISFHTFKGRLIVILDYALNHMLPETAAEIFEAFSENIEAFSLHGNLHSLVHI